MVLKARACAMRPLWPDSGYAFLVPRGRAPFGQHQESRPLAWSNDILFLNGFVNTIDWNQNESDLSDLTLSMRRVTGSPWIADFRCYAWPEVAILGADQKKRGLWGREYGYACLGFPRALVAASHVIKDKSSGVENAASGCYASLAHAWITCPLNKWTFFFFLIT